MDPAPSTTHHVPHRLPLHAGHLDGDDLAQVQQPRQMARLIGIVAQGTTRYALFSDSRPEGHIVHRGDCLGKEKARVKEIGAGFVTLELSPEPVPNQDPRAPEERSIPLYPKELPLTEEEGSDDEGRPARRPSGDSGTSSGATTPPVLPPGAGNLQ